MSEKTSEELLKSYCNVLADQIELNFGKAEMIGIGAALNNVGQLLIQLHTPNVNEQIGSINPKFGILNAYIALLIDAIVMAQGASAILEASETDQGTAKSLALVFQTTNLSDITGNGGHMIELRSLLKAIPALTELDERQQVGIVRELRRVHQQALRVDVPAEMKGFITSLVDAFKGCSLSEVENIFSNEINRLDGRIRSLNGKLR